MSLLPALPFMIPLISGALSLVSWSSLRTQRVIAIVGCAALLGVGGLLFHDVWTHGMRVLPVGGWVAPYGIVLAVDLLSALMVLLTGIVGLATAIYSVATIRPATERAGYYPLMHLLLAGVAGSFVTGDLFNLYVWFEIMLLASFALLAMGGERAQMAGALKYVVLNLVSSSLFLAGAGLLYGLAGTLNFADLAVKLHDVQEPARVTIIAMLFLVAFGIKSAAFPLFFWLPASYHTAPVAVSALFAGLLTKVGVYALLRVFTLLFTQDVSYTHTLLQWMACATMLAGVLGALAQTEFRRMLSFTIISSIGYLLLGLSWSTPLALTGALFYLTHNIIVKSNLFFVSGATWQITGSHRLAEMGGLWKSHPGLSWLFLLPALSLAGIPPLSGFWGKFMLVKAGLDLQHWIPVALVLLTGLLTLAAMMTVWMEAFWKPAPRPPQSQTVPLPMLGVLIALTTLTVLIGVCAEPVWQAAHRAADELLQPQHYIRAVMEAQP